MRRRYVEIDCNRTFAGAAVIKDLRAAFSRPKLRRSCIDLIAAGAGVLRDGLNPPDAVRAGHGRSLQRRRPDGPVASRPLRIWIPSFRAPIAALSSSFVASLDGSPNPFARPSEFVNHLLHACPSAAPRGQSRVDRRRDCEGARRHSAEGEPMTPGQKPQKSSFLTGLTGLLRLPYRGERGCPNALSGYHGQNLLVPSLWFRWRFWLFYPPSSSKADPQANILAPKIELSDHRRNM